MLKGKLRMAAVAPLPKHRHAEAEPEAQSYGPRLLGRVEAAHYLGVSTASVDRLIDAQQLPVVRLPVANRRDGLKVGVGRSVLIDRRDLDRLIDASKDRR